MGKIRLKIQRLLDEEMLERIHNLALEVLKKCGIKVSNETAIRKLSWHEGIIKERISSHDFVLQEDKKKALDKIYQSACKKLGDK